MEHQINPSRVAGVVTEANQILASKDFTHGEVILGLTELIGRIIVEDADTHIQMKELVQVVAQHLDRTITVGNSARGKSLVERG